MARRSVFPLGRGQSQRRRVGWEEGIGQVADQTNFTGSASDLVSSALTVLLDGLTLVRTRGVLQFSLLTASAPSEGFAGAFGIGVATTAAVTAGASSVPTPITEQSWDGWLYWVAIKAVSMSVVDQTDDSPLNVGLASQTIHVDSKAMRKLREDDSIYGAMELTEIGTATLRWAFDSRMLIKLP